MWGKDVTPPMDTKEYHKLLRTKITKGLLPPEKSCSADRSPIIQVLILLLAKVGDDDTGKSAGR